MKFTKATAALNGRKGGKKTMRKYGKKHYKEIAIKRWGKELEK